MLDRGGQFDIENGARLSAHMAAVAQLVEPLVVVQVVAGSNPVGRPILLCSRSELRRMHCEALREAVLVVERKDEICLSYRKPDRPRKKVHRPCLRCE